MERVARFADYENEAIETPRRKRGAAAVIYDININININTSFTSALSSADRPTAGPTPGLTDNSKGRAGASLSTERKDEVHVVINALCNDLSLRYMS